MLRGGVSSLHYFPFQANSEANFLTKKPIQRTYLIESLIGRCNKVGILKDSHATIKWRF
jgi:hypothetical protein